MKKWIALVLTLTVILTMSACKGNDPETPTQTPTVAPTVAPSEPTPPDATDPTVPDATDPTVPDATDPTVPDVTDPDENEDLVYDMADYQWFSDIFEENPEVNWMSMGRYTIHLGGLHTPVVVNMNGLDVLSVTAFDQTVDLGTDGMANDYHDGYSGVQSIRSTYDAVVIHVSFGEMGDGSILITKNQIFKYPNEFDSGIFLWVKDDGTLGYRQTWIDTKIEIEGWYMLYYPTSRDMVMYQEGTAEIVDGELVLTAEKTVLLSDYFDLDALFAEAKAYGMFTEYETVDELFEANRGEKEPVELVFDMNDYKSFGYIIDEKTYEEWDSMGRYTIRLEGLSTPVTLEMDGPLVLSVSAYDQTKIVNIGPYQTYMPASFSCTDNAIIVNETLDYCGSTWILTAGGCYEFHPEGSFSTQVYVSKDGTMQYSRYWGEYVTTFNQTSPLMVCTSRDQFLYETGRAEIVDGEVVLTVEETVVLLDLYDPDAMFAEAKAYGMFTEYETVDELFEANKENV